MAAIQQEREALLREKKRKDVEATKTYDSASLWGAHGGGGGGGGGSKRRRGPAEDAAVKVRLPAHWSTDTFWSQMRNAGDENGDKVTFRLAAPRSPSLPFPLTNLVNLLRVLHPQVK